MKIKISKSYTLHVFIYFISLQKNAFELFLINVGHMSVFQHCYLETKNELCYLFNFLLNSNKKKIQKNIIGKLN